MSTTIPTDRSTFKMADMKAWSRIFTVVLIHILFTGGFAQRCPNGWKDRPDGDSCYLFGVGVPRLSWFAARQLCQSSQGDLLKINNAVEKDWIIENTQQLDRTFPGAQEFWVGLNVQDDPLIWKWADGEAAEMSLIRWGSGEPSDPNNEQCAEIWDGLFNDKSCLTPIEYVCERPKSIPLSCDVDLGWQYYDGACYKYIPGYRTFTQASDGCQANDAVLVSVTSESIQKTVNHLAAINSIQDVWIGLYKPSGKWKFKDGTAFTPVTKTYWQPSGVSGSKPSGVTCAAVNATALDQRSWYEDTCSEGKSYICTKPEGVCVPGFDQHQSRCYLAVFTNKTWNAANDYCKERDAKFVDIRNATEQSFINSYLMKQRSKGMDTVWIGLSKGIEGSKSWTWTPNEFDQVTYSNWAIGADRRVSPLGQTCVYITAGDVNGQWRTDLECTKSASFLCVAGVQKTNPQTTTTMAPDKTPITGSGSVTKVPKTTTEAITRAWSQECGEFWEKSPFSNVCYQFHEQKLNWMQADEYCALNGGRLLSINSIHEQFYLAGLIRVKTSGSYWIGANSRRDDEGWRWSDDSAFSFMNWKPGQPDDVRGIEDCAAMSVSSSYWSDFSCDLKFGYICKKSGRMTTTYVPPPTDMIIPDDKSYGCPEDWVGYQQKCFLIARMKMSWKGALNYCRKQGSDLASVANEDEYNFLLSQLPKSHCYNIYNNDTSCTKWAADGECTKNPIWMAKHCHLACNLCVQNCRNTYNDFKCKGWAAMDECEKNPNWMSKNCALSCGICDSAIYGGFWIGLNDKAYQMSFRWSDGQKVRFTSWAKGEPNNFGKKNEDCVSMFLQDGKWNDANCDNVLPGFICKQDKKLLPKTTVSPLSVGCVNDSLGYSAYCYGFVDDTLPYNDAEIECQRSGGHLATINNRYVQAFVSSQLVGRSGDYWVGLSDQVNPGTLESWTSGANIQFTHWARTFTVDYDGTCVYLVTSHPVGLWSRSNCSVGKSYICEYPRAGYTTTTTTPGTTTTTAPPTCETGWRPSTKYCFKAYRDGEKRTWMEARDFCRGLGGDLPSIHGIDEEDAIYSLIQDQWSTFWVGFNDRDRESDFTWSDGSPVDYTNWLDGEPNNAFYNEDCVNMMSWTRSWNDNHCSNKQAFICQIRKGLQVPDKKNMTSITEGGTCGDDVEWVYHAGYCYFLYDQGYQGGKVNWFQANEYCISNNSHLVSVHSTDEADFLIALTTSSLHSFNARWIGLNEIDLEAGYRWTDGTPFNFIYWSRNEPTDNTGGERCVMHQYGRWYDTNCGSKLNGFICKKKNGTNEVPSLPIPPPTPLIPAGCPPEFEQSPFSNKCYLFKTTPVSWHEAKKICTELGKGVQLLSIGSQMEQDYISSLLVKYRAVALWIGFIDTPYARGEYIWEDNSPVLYTNWAKDEPNGRSENCVEMYTQKGDSVGKWNDHLCHARRGYACQAQRDPRYPVPTPATSCQAGYQAYGTSCYKFLEDKKDFETAQTNCRIHGGTLVSITSAYEQAFINVLTSTVADKYFWIGLTKHTEDSSNLTTLKDFRWTDGWPMSYTNWDEDQPTLQEKENCVVVQKGKWIDTRCDHDVSSVCEINLVDPPTTPVPGICPVGTFSYMDSCYTAEIQNKKNWVNARDDCEKRGMKLTSVNSLDELTFILDMLRNMNRGTSPKSWIGFSRYTGAKRVYHDDDDDDDYDDYFDEDDGGGNSARMFSWVDKSEITFQNWNDGEPSDSWNNQNEECTEMYSSGRWNDVNCHEYNRAYVCKGPQVYKTQSTAEAPTTTTTTEQETTQITTTTTEILTTSADNQVVTGSTVNINTTDVTMKTATKRTFHHFIPRRTNPKLKTAKDEKLTAGEIIGILIGIIGIGVIGGAIYFVVYHVGRTNTYNTKQHGFSNALYLKSSDNVSLSEETSMMGSTVKLCEKSV